ncbi:hypothetical protein JXA85_06665 [Candidatus Woesearchaeota archaeon]|nr:hypothetical protein [Candidatus Woesearchaeota archaeon]
MKKVNIPLKDEIHTRAKLISVLKNKGLLKYLEEAIEEAVVRDGKILDKIPNIKK